MPDAQFDPGSPSKWQSIRPWRPRFSLSVREITSVSATFVISSLSSQPSLSLLLPDDDYDPDDASATKATQPVITDTLSKGVSVKVNGTPWQKCLARLDDDADEAMIIIYGLMPGRNYDIELGVIPGDEKLKGRIVTESASRDPTRSDPDNASTIPQVSVFSSASPHSLSIDPSPSPPSPSPPSTPNGPSHSQTFEDHLASLKASLSHLQAEHENLSNSLKSARRDSQKAQAAQRTEITSLKRAAQKHSAGDTRMKQKVRALEEAVKQTIKGREDVEAEYAELDAARLEQDAELADASRRFSEARARAEEWRALREKAEEEANNKLQGARAELAAVETRLDKLRAKRERLEGRTGTEEDSAEAKEEDGSGSSDAPGPGGLVGELETKLREMVLERERIEADPFDPVAVAVHEDESPAADVRAHGHGSHHGRSPHHPHGRNKRPQHQHSHPHPRGPAFSPPNSAPTGRTSAPALPRNPSRSSGKGVIARRKSSPPPQSHAERSVLSLNAPPFEPASVRGKSSGSGWATGER
ncbi:hypothetical protein BC834DRAFT_1033452 [Gloeopeniophorella convolvens]|nr:hypothetical protein BC834DRAFT_1033452 [Gloeopeniophorella convolvens]